MWGRGRVWGVLTALAFTVSAPAFGVEVRVRLKKGLTQLELSGLGLTVGSSPASIKPVGLPRMAELQIRLGSNDKRWTTWRVSTKSNGLKETHMGDRLFIEGETLRIGLDPVPHNLEVVVTPNKKFDVIARMDLEKYLTGVLPSEMPASWPIEALKAQAIASRSYALAIARERQNEEFDLEATVFDQVFDLRNHIGVEPNIQKKIATVVRETSGQILRDAQGRPVKAHYHADCGGQTELARNVWGTKGQEMGTTKDALCPLSPLANWQYRISRVVLRDLFAAYYGLGSGFSLESLATRGRTPSGRIVDVDVVMSDREPRRVTSHQFRQIIGFSNLKSTNFRMVWQGDMVIFEGRGHGHGVGMCQYGARQLAKRGLPYNEILKTYYSNAILGPLTEPVGGGPKKIL